MFPLGTSVVSIVTVLMSILPTSTQQNMVNINTYSNENSGNGEYKFRFMTSDGTAREESGKFEGEGNYVVRGYYSYIDPTGQEQYVSFYADKTGYHPTLMKKPAFVESAVLGLPPALVATLIG